MSTSTPYSFKQMFPMKYATIWRRVWAFVLDFLILSPVIILTYYLKHHVHNSFFVAGAIILTPSVASVYGIWMHSRGGQTFGMMGTKIRLVDQYETSTPSLRQAFLLQIVSIVFSICFVGLALHAIALHTYLPTSFAKNSTNRLVTNLDLCWILADIICIFCNRKHRSLHDLIAGTVVLRDRDYMLQLELRRQQELG